MAMQRAKAIAGKSSRFWVRLLKAGGCWKMESRRVRTARMLNHCLEEALVEVYEKGQEVETYMTTRLMK